MTAPLMVVSWNPLMGSASLDGYSITGHHMKPTNLQVAWPRCVKRGDNTIIPGSPGQLAREQEQDQDQFDLKMLLAGGVDVADTPYETDIIGLRRNYDDIVEVCRPSLVLMELVDPSGIAYSGNVQPTVSQLGERDEGGQIVKFTISIIVPRGELLLEV